jgi:hypothetical protein
MAQRYIVVHLPPKWLIFRSFGATFNADNDVFKKHFGYTFEAMALTIRKYQIRCGEVPPEKK